MTTLCKSWLVKSAVGLVTTLVAFVTASSTSWRLPPGAAAIAENPIWRIAAEEVRASHRGRAKRNLLSSGRGPANLAVKIGPIEIILAWL